jgi:hypothetical protein
MNAWLQATTPLQTPARQQRQEQHATKRLHGSSGSWAAWIRGSMVAISTSKSYVAVKPAWPLAAKGRGQRVQTAA